MEDSNNELPNGRNISDSGLSEQKKSFYHQKFLPLLKSRTKILPNEQDRAEVFSDALMRFFEKKASNTNIEDDAAYFATMFDNMCRKKLAKQKSQQNKLDIQYVGSINEESVNNTFHYDTSSLANELDATLKGQLETESFQIIQQEIAQQQSNDPIYLAFQLFKKQEPKMYKLFHLRLIKKWSYKKIAAYQKEKKSVEAWRKTMESYLKKAVPFFFQTDDALIEFTANHPTCGKLLHLKFIDKEDDKIIAQEINISLAKIKDRIESCKNIFGHFFITKSSSK